MMTTRNGGRRTTIRRRRSGPLLLALGGLGRFLGQSTFALLDEGPIDFGAERPEGLRCKQHVNVCAGFHLDEVGASFVGSTHKIPKDLQTGDTQTTVMTMPSPAARIPAVVSPPYSRAEDCV